jgi:hypothetical protein
MKSILHPLKRLRFSSPLLLYLLFAAVPCPGAPSPPPQSVITVQTVENAGLLFTDNDAGVSGTDAGYSIPLGRQSLWLFGDVFLLDPHAPAKPYVGAVSNCALLVPSGTGAAPLHQYTFLTDPKTGVARQVLSTTAEEKQGLRFWPLGGWFDARTNRAYLYYSRVRVNGGGPFGFTIEGHGLAVADTAQPTQLRFQRLSSRPGQELWWTPEANGTLYGCAVFARAADPFLYLMGVQERDGKKWARLARVTKDHLADPSAYEYYSGGTPIPHWSKNGADAVDVPGLTEFPNELSVDYNPYLGGYLATQSVGVSDRLRLSLAPNPWGPYTPVGEIGAPHRALEQAFCYAGKEHPELAQDHGRIIYITYVDSQRYWLQLLKITLQKRP